MDDEATLLVSDMAEFLAALAWQSYKGNVHSKADIAQMQNFDEMRTRIDEIAKAAGKD